MENQYKQLTLGERYQIEGFCKLNLSARKIALKLGRSNRTISNEFARCMPYSADIAQRQALQTRSSAAKSSKCSEDIKKKVSDMLVLHLTPEQIAGRMKREKCTVIISTNTVYRIIKTSNWQHMLARKGKIYRHRKPYTAGAKLIPNRVDIDERPAIVDEKQEIGHWEADTVYGQDGYFVTLVERVSKLLVTRRVKSKSKKDVTAAIKSMMKPFKAVCHSITFDNGGEFAGHEAIKKYLKCDTFFAKPYHSWERGLNENTNGLLRRFFPKGMKIGALPQKLIEQAQFLINMRPRKTLDYLSPYEFLTGKSVSLIAEI